MKQFISIVLFLVFPVLFSSCATVHNVDDKAATAYTLKSQKEKMQSKIIQNKKTMLAR